jgi:hypothetical protein
MRLMLLKSDVYIYAVYEGGMAQYFEDIVLTPRDSPDERAIRAGYRGPKNNRGQPDTSGSEEMGVMIYPSNHPYVSYSGEWKDGIFEGEGRIVLANGHRYTGGFEKGGIEGRGVYTFPDGQVLDGEFMDELIVRGTHISPGDFTFQGAFVNGQMRNGTITSNNGDVFTGIQEGPTKRVGVYRYTDGDVFSGTFDKDVENGWWLLNGYGEMIVNSSPNKFIYHGDIHIGERHGHGIMKMMSGPQKGERYMAKFDDGLEVIKSRKPLVKEEGEEEEEEPSPSGGRKHSKRRGVKRSKRRGVKRYSRR